VYGAAIAVFLNMHSFHVLSHAPVGRVIVTDFTSFAVSALFQLEILPVRHTTDGDT